MVRRGKQRKRSAAEIVNDERISDFYGNPTSLAECMWVVPRDEYGLVRERVRYERDQERKLSALAQQPDFRGENGLCAYCALFVDWELAMREEVKITDDQAICLAIFLDPAKDGSLEVDPLSGWPVHWAYCSVAKRLHAFDPSRFRNRKGDRLGQETVKGKVVIAFSKKLNAYFERVMPGVWPIDLVEKVVEDMLGDPSHRVPHSRKK